VRCRNATRFAIGAGSADALAETLRCADGRACDPRKLAPATDGDELLPRLACVAADQCNAFVPAVAVPT
jgi:hypothetical protein